MEPKESQKRSPGAPASAPELPRRPASQVRGALASKMGARIVLGIDFYRFVDFWWISARFWYRNRLRNRFVEKLCVGCFSLKPANEEVVDDEVGKNNDGRTTNSTNGLRRRSERRGDSATRQHNNEGAAAEPHLESSLIDFDRFQLILIDFEFILIVCF